MGADLAYENLREEGGEPVADLRARFNGALRGVEVPPERAASMIDEYPILSVVAAFAEGPTVMRGVKELRVKESDRIAVVVGNLRALGADVDELPDGFVVRGTAPTLRGRVVTHADHRMAMAFGILGALPGNEIEIDDRECVAVSYPTFWSDLSAVTAS
jgi:3-phosphoshikimate 1-carboxyvinyltransferase